MRNDSLKKLEKARKGLLPGEYSALYAYLYNKDVVTMTAEEGEGFEPDSGFRPMTAAERIKEFDGLSIEQRNGIIDTEGMAWYLAYAEEIQRLKDALPNLGG